MDNGVTAEKVCSKCGIIKPISEFYKHSQMRDGHLNKCKTCTRSDVTRRRVENIDAVRDYDRRRSTSEKRVAARKSYSKTDSCKKSQMASKKKWIKNNPLKRKAHSIVRTALSNGTLVRKPCEVCGEMKVHAHHSERHKLLRKKGD